MADCRHCVALCSMLTEKMASCHTLSKQVKDLELRLRVNEDIRNTASPHSNNGANSLHQVVEKEELEVVKHRQHVEALQQTIKNEKQMFAEATLFFLEQNRTQATDLKLARSQVQEQQDMIDELRLALDNRETAYMVASEPQPVNPNHQIDDMQKLFEEAQGQVFGLQTQLREAKDKITQLEAAKLPPTRLQTLLANDPQISSQPTAGLSNVKTALNPNTYSDVPAYMSALPPARQQTLDRLPTVIVPPQDAGNALFSRKLLSEHIGGGTQSLIVSIDLKKRKPLAEEHGISGYLCPNRDHNLWCPTRPGMHGYMFVGLGREAITYTKAEMRHVFVGMGTKQYRYLGLYEAVRTDGLTAEEWGPLPEEFKSKYSSTTKDKSKDDPRTVTQIRAAYNDGSLLAPCVLLKCVGYDRELYRTLAEASGDLASSAPGVATLKRLHESDSADGLEMHRRKSARSSI